HRLLDEHVFPRFKCGDGLRSVVLITRQDEDKIHIRVSEQLSVVRAAVARAESCRVAERSSAVRRTHSLQLDPLRLAEEWTVHPPGQVSGPDERNAQSAGGVQSHGRFHAVRWRERRWPGTHVRRWIAK